MKKTDVLDQVLQGKSDDVKARVLDLVIKLGVDTDDEFWLIFIALGQLQILIEDSPKDWQSLFATFHTDLEQWTDTNLETLELLSRKAQALASLAQNSKELNSTLREFSNFCTTSMLQSTQSITNLTSSVESLKRSLQNVQETLEDNQRQGRRLNEQVMVEIEGLKRKLTANTGQHLWVPWAITLFSSVTAIVLLLRHGPR